MSLLVSCHVSIIIVLNSGFCSCVQTTHQENLARVLTRAEEAHAEAAGTPVATSSWRTSG